VRSIRKAWPGYSGLYINKLIMKLEEGECYDFIVQKTLKIGDREYFLLEGPGGEKYLLPEKYYKHYRIEVNSIINCRVDKINCRGKVYLEPANPFYNEGQEYSFKVTGRDIRINEAGVLIPVLIVIDRFRNDLVVPVSMVGSYDIRKNSEVTLKIHRINKGRIIFTETDKVKNRDSIEVDEINEFYIYDRKKGVDGKDYFMVSDRDDAHHLIPVDQYSYYGLKKGGTFRGKYIQYHDTGQYKIEPVNPYYKIGNKYHFELISANERPDGPGKVLIVVDEYGLKHEVFVTGDYIPRKRVELRVEKIRKGWPLLTPV